MPVFMPPLTQPLRRYLVLAYRRTKACSRSAVGRCHTILAGNQGMYSGAVVLATTSYFQQSQDTLFALADDTGKALLDYNDLTKGIV
jgi:hypothetical protein